MTKGGFPACMGDSLGFLGEVRDFACACMYLGVFAFPKPCMHGILCVCGRGSHLCRTCVCVRMCACVSHPAGMEALGTRRQKRKGMRDDMEASLDEGE